MNRRKQNQRRNLIVRSLIVAGVVLVLVVGAVLANLLEARMTTPVENAGERMTAYTDVSATAQVFMNGRWYEKKDVDTVLLIGIDNHALKTNSGSYNNANQADFLALLVYDKASQKTSVIHLNRDTMTTMTTLGVTGKAAGTRYAQLALAYNYGSGGSDSGRNTAKAVSHLLYGAEVDHFITLAMEAVPVLNDWVGGVTVQVESDMTGIDASFKPGSEVTLQGAQALDYVRVRYGLENSTNLQRMERQRAYASRWYKAAQPKLKDTAAVSELIVQLKDLYHSDCTAAQLADLAALFGKNPSVEMHTLPGESVRGEQYMEFYVDEAAVQQLVLELFYAPV